MTPHVELVSPRLIRRYRELREPPAQHQERDARDKLRPDGNVSVLPAKREEPDE